MASNRGAGSRLWKQVVKASQRGARRREVEAIVALARRLLEHGDPGMANFHLAHAARIIRRRRVARELLHEVLGLRAGILRRGGKLEQAKQLYAEAADAAARLGLVADRSRWLGEQGSMLARGGDRDGARRLLEAARGGLKKKRGGGETGDDELAGHLASLAIDEGDDDAKAAAFMRALESASARGDDVRIAEWAIRHGRVLVRLRRYADAWRSFRTAMAAARRTRDEDRVRDAARAWAGGLCAAHRWQEASDVLLRVAHRARPGRIRYSLMDESRTALGMAGAWTRLIDVDTQLIKALRNHPPAAERVATYRAEIQSSRARRAPRTVSADRPGLEDYVLEAMARYEKSGNAEGMAGVAHLVCDVALGLGDTREAAWTGLLREVALRHRIVADAAAALSRAEKPERSLELSQRYKGVGFCLPNLMRLRAAGRPPRAAREYLTRLDALTAAVNALRGTVAADTQQRVERVRAAGEALLEEGEVLRARDPLLQARLGGIVHPRALVDHLPVNSPFAIGDLLVGAHATIIHLLYRAGNAARVTALVGDEFTAADALRLTGAWLDARVAHSISQEQRDALLTIAKDLHDRVFCSFASLLGRLLLPQVVLIPDVATRHLPLHLALVCEDNVAEIAAHIMMKPRPERIDFFCDVFPVEYASCLQAVVASGFRRRPRRVSRVVTFADPTSDLPASRRTASWLGEHVGPGITAVPYIGAAATRAALDAELPRSELVVVSGHGHFNAVTPTESALEMADGPWRMAEIIDRQALVNGPVVVLSACEVGATAPTLDDVEAAGIPGMLISAGAASVLAALWPVEDVSMGYVAEQFLSQLAHQGLSPAAALFRALHALRRWGRDDAVARCREIMRGMEEDGRSETCAEQYLMLDNLATRLEDSDDPFPFSGPELWAGIVTVGSGWHTPAGATIGTGPEQVVALARAVDACRRTDRLLRRSRHASAQSLLNAQSLMEDALPELDGVHRARALEILARAVLEGAPRSPARRQEALALLARAEALARAEEDRDILASVQATRRRIGRLATGKDRS